MAKPRFLNAAPLLLACSVASQETETRPLALVNARVLTMTDAGTIERGTIVVRDGRIEALGADVTVPPGARVVDVAGGTVMPGLVHAWSRAGTEEQRSNQIQIPPQFRGRGRSRGGGRSAGGGNNAVVKSASKVSETLYARQDVFGELLRAGVTTLVVRPEETGFPGMSARVAPDARTETDLTMADEVYVVVDPAPSPKAIKAMKEALDKAEKVLEERKKPKEEPKAEEPKPAEAKEGEKPDASKEGAEKKESEQPKPEEGKEGAEKKEGEKPQEPAAEQKRPEPKKDPNIEILADVLDGKRKAFLRLSSPMEIQHYTTGIGNHSIQAVVVADRPDPRQGFMTHQLEWLKKSASIVLTTPELEQIPNTRVLVNTPAELHAAGIEVGFVLPDDGDSVEELAFDLMELVRCGLPADAALRAVTAVPAKALGLDKEVGSIAEGLRADLLVFTADPLDPTARLRTVILEGREVEARVDR